MVLPKSAKSSTGQELVHWQFYKIRQRSGFDFRGGGGHFWSSLNFFEVLFQPLRLFIQLRGSFSLS